MNVRAWLSFAVFGSLLIGCGGDSVKEAAPPVSPLAGNWLIVGPMPVLGFTAPGTGVFSLAMTFDVNDNNVSASGYGSGFCASNAIPPIYDHAFAFESLSTGVIATDGSFDLQTPESNPGYSLAMHGLIPTINAGQFSGTYTASFNSPVGPPCVGNSAGMFTATPFPLVNGVYNGVGTFQALTGGASTATPITVKVNLQQGAPVLDPATGVSKTSIIAIAGSIQVEGIPCFKSGVANTTLFGLSGESLSSIQGNIFSVNFTMDDGSPLNLTGALTDSTEGHISALFSTAFSGKCAGAFSPLMDLTRQS